MTSTTRAPTAKQLWSSLRGCNCPPIGGDITAHDVCTREWVRCNERLRAIREALRSHGYSLDGVRS